MSSGHRFFFKYVKLLAEQLWQIWRRYAAALVFSLSAKNLRGEADNRPPPPPAVRGLRELLDYLGYILHKLVFLLYMARDVRFHFIFVVVEYVADDHVWCRGVNVRFSRRYRKPMQRLPPLCCALSCEFCGSISEEISHILFMSE